VLVGALPTDLEGVDRRMVAISAMDEKVLRCAAEFASA
jgi:hypothetical protein